MNEKYSGVELGPIRPPSEATSLMLRITRNCPWNNCKFCGLYKDTQFSLRSTDHILRDIDNISLVVDCLKAITNLPKSEQQVAYSKMQSEADQNALHSASLWFRAGMKSIFLQDANSLVIKPSELIKILKRLISKFPEVERVTSYARAQTIAKISDEDMLALKEAGLNRIHIGMESASDEILKFIKKGVDKSNQIIAGKKVKEAGIELSEYFMPGLGGNRLSRSNALETADAINQINPDFIRIRTLGIPEHTDLHQDVLAGEFTPLGDVDKARELLLFIESLEGITSTIKSDHILNLFQDVEGTLPHDRDKIIAPIKQFLELSPEKQMLYIVGRRTGVFSKIYDLFDPMLLPHAERAINNYKVTLENVDQFAANMIKGYI